ncbi:RanGTP-binding-like protein [Parathielavia appendiculata]|uniref:RanGTP-binding-like protein n=1 Tax=Parathielavia appendiculata TaxID=2587402 RepID=A0AAN6TSW4_9PEZI|nr:RanGTP-binding-like protein [Parathielavia appendiculata]
MDAFLEYLGHHAIRSATNYGFNLTFGYALQQCSRLLKSVNDKAVRTELKALQKLLDGKVKIISPALDLIEFKSGRGNTFLESAVPLAKTLRRDIVRLGKRLDNAASAEEHAPNAAQRDLVSEARHTELLLIMKDIRTLLERIDRDIPLLQFAITVSGEKMSTAMTPGISPSRMMQASALLSFADAHFVLDPNRTMQVGPSFTLSLYMLFLGHSQTGPDPGAGEASPLTPSVSEAQFPKEAPYGLGAGDRKPIWQEVMHKARVRLCRTPANRAFDPTQGHRPIGADGTHFSAAFSDATALPCLGLVDGYSYHLEIIEDLDDGRLHDGDGPKPRPYDGLQMAGIRESIPIHQVSKIFYTDTGRILNIGNNDDGDNNPVLLLKRDPTAKSPIKVRQEWLDVPEPEMDMDESQSDTALESFDSDDQEKVDRQLLEETAHSAESPSSQDSPQNTNLPQHLDPEWLALEVYREQEDGGDEERDDDDEEEEEEEEEEGDGAGSDGEAARRALTANHHAPRNRVATDSKLMSLIGHLSLRAGSPPQYTGQPSAELRKLQEDAYATRSPFGSIASSLSLLEMLIRLTSLQEFQQTSHLAIPDHILTFFLEETSTTGRQGEEHWRMRSEAKWRMGFDPYTNALPR